MAECAETAQHGGDEAAHQRAVAVRQSFENGLRGFAVLDLVADMANQPKTECADAMPPRGPLPPAAQRALAEAEARRAEARKAKENDPASHSHEPNEINGPKGPEPTRYGDGEIKGIASDF